MRACIILHNMIVEDERDVENLENLYDQPVEGIAHVSRDRTNNSFSQFLARRMQVRDNTLSHQLRQDLIEHHWNRVGDD